MARKNFIAITLMNYPAKKKIIEMKYPHGYHHRKIFNLPSIEIFLSTETSSPIDLIAEGLKSIFFQSY